MADLTAPGLSEEDAHHLLRALRLRSGELVTASDGAGSWRPCRLELEAGRVPRLAVEGDVRHEPPARPEITVAVALPKGDRGDWAVQKLTEVGVDRIVPLETRRSVVRWSGERLGRGLDRLGRIARQAAMQSRRVRLPVLGVPLTVAGVVAGHPGAVAAAEPGGAPPDLARPVVLIGPEGGWEEGELPPGMARLGLGPGVLRTETAAVVAGAALSLLRAGILVPPTG